VEELGARELVKMPKMWKDAEGLLWFAAVLLLSFEYER
jgi:hypothetical protein